MGGYIMDNYVRYLIRFIAILFLVGVAFLFVIVIKNNTTSKLNNKTDLTNVINHDEADTTKEDSKTSDTKKEETTKESTTDNTSSTTNNTTSKSITKYNGTNSTTTTKSNTTTNSTAKTVTSNETNNSNNTNNQKETVKTEETKKDTSTSKTDTDKEVEFSLNFDKKTLKVGETDKIVVTSDTKNLKVNYKSFDKSVATVTSTGTIKALKKGSTYLEVNVNDDSSKIIELVVTNSTTNNTNNNSSNNNSSTSNDNSQNTDTSDKSNSNNTPTKPSDSNSTTTDNNQTTDNDKTDTKNDTTTTPSVKNGWYTVNGKKYFYKNGNKVTDSYVDYIYLDKNGVAQAKVGNFSATLYGATAWTNQSVNIRKAANQNSSLLGTIPTGGKVKILSSDNSSTKYIKIKYNNITGYVYSDFLLINLPDVIPDMLYEITSASSSTAKAANTAIPGITGKNLYGFTKKYNSKIGKETYYAPLLYPTAKKLQSAYNKAKKDGYNLKVYDAYRPHDVTVSSNSNFRKLYNSNSKVKNAIDYDKEGNYWGPSWFLASNVSAHNKGVALDIAITNSKNQELKAQTAYDTLDTTSIVKYNNSVANKLRSIMLSQGFSPLESEWWHFQDNDYYSNSKVVTFHLK